MNMNISQTHVILGQLATKKVLSTLQLNITTLKHFKISTNRVNPISIISTMFIDSKVDTSLRKDEKVKKKKSIFLARFQVTNGWHDGFFVY